MPAADRHALRLLIALVAATSLVLAACGDDEPAEPAQSTTPVPATTSAPMDDESEQVDEEDGDVVVAPTPAAIASGHRLDALLVPYARVTKRVNFLVAAETLRADAVDSRAGEKVERERFGAVRVEIERMDSVLRAARPRVAAVSLVSVEERYVQGLMLSAIDARLRALAQLERTLDALADEDAAASEVEALEDRWQASWNESLRYAREATTSMQDARATMGLELAPEDRIR